MEKKKEKKIEECRKKADEMRIEALEMAWAAGKNGAHMGGGLSLIEIMAVLYLMILNYDIENPLSEERDRVIFSKGHGTLALYPALYHAGFIKKEELATYKRNRTNLYAHPSMNLEKGIEFSGGSLGQGLSLGVGTCLALNRKNNKKSKVFVILGDGECDEGSVWEAAMAASHFELTQL
ncbi:MAG: 1-deoxy-D-xylulose-5-phosphate synthase N-terminal domain-containing protein, partial [Anaerovorax sp.]